MICNSVDRVWSGTAGHADEALTPLILPPYPSQYCFPEAEDICTNLNSSTDSNRSGNNACRFNLLCGDLCFIVGYNKYSPFILQRGLSQLNHRRPTSGMCKANTKTNAQPKAQTSYTSGACNTVTNKGNKH